MLSIMAEYAKPYIERDYGKIAVLASDMGIS
jgi:hypothetical protein